LIHIFFNVELADKEETYRQAYEVAYDKAATDADKKYGPYVKKYEELKSSISSVPPKEIIDPVNNEVATFVVTPKPKVHTPLFEGRLVPDLVSLDPYIDKLSSFIYDHLPELNTYTVVGGALLVAGTASYFYGTGGIGKTLLGGIKAVALFAGNAFMGLANITDPGADSTTPDGDSLNNIPQPTAGSATEMETTENNKNKTLDDTKGKSKETSQAGPYSQYDKPKGTNNSSSQLHSRGRSNSKHNNYRKLRQQNFDRYFGYSDTE
jgi:hypothetical protein